MTTWTKETGDFDFLNGHFDVVHRQLSKPLTGSDEWQEYDGTCSARTHFDGAISIDEMQFPTKSSYGLSLRLFDPIEKQWTIYWVGQQDDGARPTGPRQVERRLLLAASARTSTTARTILVSYAWSRHHRHHRALGAVLLRRRRRDLGGQLDDGLHPPRLRTAASGHSQTHQRLRLPGRRMGLPQPPPQARPRRAGGVARVRRHDEGLHLLRRPDQLRRGLVPDRRLPGRDLPPLRPSRQNLVDPLDQQPPRHPREPPVIGSFTDGIGIFEGPDAWQGQAIDVRFIWTPGDHQASWEQLFSTDNGKTWISNWQMTHQKTKNSRRK